VPVAPDLLYARYVELGASAALIARSLIRGCCPQQLAEAVTATRQRIAWWQRAGYARREWARRELVSQIARQTSW
jgi:hypothetical protein